MLSIWQTYKELQNLIKEKIKFPFIYTIFLIDGFMLWKPKYVSLIHANKWIPDNIQRIFLTFFNYIYSHFLWLFISLFIIILIIYIIFSKTSFFDFLPEDVETTDGKTLMWNPVSAISRLINIFFLLVREYWIYWLTLNVFLNPHQFTTNFLNEDITANPLITSSYLTKSTLTITYVLFIVNMLITIVLILRSLFEIRVPTDRYFVLNNKLDMYMEIASFEKEVHGVYTKTMILKPKYEKKALYLLVNGDSDRYKNTLVLDKTEIPYTKKSSKIINSSTNLSEIIYQFEELKSKQHKN